MEPPRPFLRCISTTTKGTHLMKSTLLWAIGIPIPVIIILYFFNAY